MPQTADQIRSAIEAELKESRMKEARAKIKKLIEELESAKKVVSAKESEISDVFEAYSDVIQV